MAFDEKGRISVGNVIRAQYEPWGVCGAAQGSFSVQA
jgi:hypothetical protein